MSKPASPSKHIGPLQIQGINKLGEVYMPGGSGFAGFTRSGCVAEVDRILDPMPAKDRGDLKLLLTLMGLVPAFMVAGFVWFLERSTRWGDWAGPFKFVRMGVRGLAMTLYYSHPQAHEVLGYEVGVYMDDLRANGTAVGSGRGSLSVLGSSTTGSRGGSGGITGMAAQRPPETRV